MQARENSNGQFRSFFPSRAKHQMQKTIEYGSVFGNYKWSAVATIDDKLIDALLPLGALQVGQRSPSSAAEKEMAGYEKRPVKFNRAAGIPFSTEGAAILAKHLKTMRVEIGRNAKDEPVYAELNADVNVEQYVPKEQDIVMADERAAYARRGKAGELEELAAKVNFDGEVGDGTAENAPVDFLRAIRAWSKAQVAAI
jgi:hypothetical protein